MRSYFAKLARVVAAWSIVPIILLVYNNARSETWVVVIGGVFSISAVILGEESLRAQSKQHMQAMRRVEDAARTDLAAARELQQRAEGDAGMWKQTMFERNKGFTTLLSFVSQLEQLRDEPISDLLATKKHPALKSADIVREQTRRRREAEFNARRAQALAELYERYAPFLVELKDDIPDDSDISVLDDYTEQEREDAVVNYVTKEEYRTLSSVERNQLALDRFWARPKSKWLVGKLYERFVGYLYEIEGYEVEYFGIAARYEDLGRDLICRRRSETLIVQCKQWSHFKTIYEKHIFQLFGTVFEYREANPDETVHALFYTTTQLSPVARRIAQTLGIELHEKYAFDTNYPAIKCNVNRQTKTRIYHLPFDQMYDDTKVGRRGEMYCRTVKEAEDAGFRRAFRWRGQTV